MTAWTAESLPTPDAAAENAAAFLARWAAYADGSSDEPPGDLAPEYLHALLADRAQARRDLDKAKRDRDSWQGIAADREAATELAPLNLPTYAWGESVTWSAGRILVPLNFGDATVADLELDGDGARTLADMLADVARNRPPDCKRCHDRGYVPDWSRGLSAEHGEPGKKPCPDCENAHPEGD